MKIALLKAGLDPKKCLTGFEYKEFSLSAEKPTYPHNIRIIEPSGLIDYDLFIVDVKELNFIDGVILIMQSDNIHDAIRSGAVLICFSAEIEIFGKDTNLTNYSWLPRELDIDPRHITNSYADIVLTKDSFPFIDFFEKNKQKFSSDCFINPRFGGMSYSTILTDKGERPVGLYQQEHKGHIFILPQVEDKENFIKSFISNVLPTIPITFQLETFYSLKTPEYAAKYFEKIPSIEEIEKKIKVANDKILQIQEKRKEKVGKKAELEKWIGLIWLKDIPLQKVVGDAFEFLGLKVERPPDTEYGPDLRIKYKEKEVIVEVEGSKSAINIDKGRQLHHWLGEESANVKGVLVGNPFNEIPIKNRPPNRNRSLFTKTLKEFAEARGFSLILSTDLFDLVCKKLKGEKVNAQELMDRMYEGKGMTRLSS